MQKYELGFSEQQIAKIERIKFDLGKLHEKYATKDDDAILFQYAVLSSVHDFLGFVIFNGKLKKI
jgi:hypothetical protein